MAHLRPGIYQHYKGQLYQVMELATHSETREKLVVYRPLYGERELWVRPLAMFDQQVDVDGVLVPRFAWRSAGQPSLQSTGQAAPASTAAAVLASQLGSAEGTPPQVGRSQKAPAQPAPARTQLPASLEERVKQAMSSGNERPDFTGMPLFEDRATAIKTGVALVVVIVLLIWLF